MIVGIDLGTTNSLIGVYDSGFVTLIADEAGERLTPSVVHFPAEGGALVGRAAVRMRTIAPEADGVFGKALHWRQGGGGRGAV